MTIRLRPSEGNCACRQNPGRGGRATPLRLSSPLAQQPSSLRKTMLMKRSTLLVILVILCLSLWTLGSAVHARVSGIVFIGGEGVVRQQHSYDCGAAALQMVFTHFHISSRYGELLHQLETDAGGASMLELKRAAEARGLLCSGWRLRTRDLPEIPFPAILFMRRNHFVVLDSYRRAGAAFIRDPARGRLQITTKKLESMWGGETLLFHQPGDGPAGVERWFGTSPSSERSRS